MFENHSLYSNINHRPQEWQIDFKRMAKTIAQGFHIHDPLEGISMVLCRRIDQGQDRLDDNSSKHIELDHRIDTTTNENVHRLKILL
jgi:hypothetical protein